MSNDSVNLAHRGRLCSVRYYHGVDETYEVWLENIGWFGAGEIVRVKLKDLILFCARGFSERFPEALVVRGSDVGIHPPVGVVVDFSEVSSFGLRTEHSLHITGSCRWISGWMNTTTTITSTVLVELEYNDLDIAEFEGINFRESVYCGRGHIVFRCCKFENDRIGVLVGTSDNAKVSVVFEQCTFQYSEECGVHVNSGDVTFVNCIFMYTGVGIATIDGTVISVIFCRFIEGTAAILLPSGAKASICRSHFLDMRDLGIMASDGSRLDIDGAIFYKCNQAIIVEGGARTCVNISHCKMEQNKVGVRIGNGRVQVRMEEINIIDSKVGIFVAVDTVGSVDCRQADFTKCQGDIADLSGDQCASVWSGVQDVRTQHERLHATRFAVFFFDVTYGYPVSAASKRALYDARLKTEFCHKCFKFCTDDWFKKCAQCKVVRYCSRACQKAHFKEHHTKCVETVTKSIALRSRGYVSCNACGKVEVLSSSQHLDACHRCFAVFYCSQRCQEADLDQHTNVCTPYEDKESDT